MRAWVALFFCNGRYSQRQGKAEAVRGIKRFQLGEATYRVQSGGGQVNMRTSEW